MKILSLHCDYIKFKPLKKAIKEPENLNSKEIIEVKEPLVIFIAVEKNDEVSSKKAQTELIKNILDLKQQVKAENIVLYPYAHLSSSLSNPDFALDVLRDTEKKLKEKDVEVYRAPFGYYKSFELKCKGHPLAELSRKIIIGDSKKEVVVDKKYDAAKLLRQISKSKLDTSKLKENDHRIIGRRLDLFSFQDVAHGMVFWHNNGKIIYDELVKFWKEEHRMAGYKEISTPQIMDSKLWKISGHWEKYKDNNFITNYEGRDFLIKPMNCPGGMLVYKNSPKSYKDLPMRVGELGVVHRTELSGVLSGLFRLIQFTQDDAHIYCADEKQVESEIIGIMDLISKFYKKFGIEFDHVELSTRPEKRIGSDKMWDMAEEILEKVLKSKKMNYSVNKGDGAFYGPKIDFHAKDSQRRTWQLSTIQLDFAMPERFDLTYIDKDNKKKRPIMLHRVIYGALERFLGILIEDKNGSLSTWLSPIQVRVLSFTDRNIQTTKSVVERLHKEGIRVEADIASSTVGEKVRDAEMQRVPYILVVGDKEEKSGSVAVRKRGSKNLKVVKVEEFVSEIKKEIKERI